MKSNRTEGNWKQFAGDVKRRLGRMLHEQLDPWSGRRDRARRATVLQAREQQPTEPRP